MAQKVFFRIFLLLISIFTILDGRAQSPKYEFRGVWVSTVINIDWPIKNSTTEAQKAELINQLNIHKKNGMNAIVFQVRPSGDAFFPSPYEPWSEYLTGIQGKAPSPFYDPLKFAIDETHKRNMEFHAWINPYRAEFSIGKSSIAPDNLLKTKPHLFIAYGTKRYFNPAKKEVQQHLINVVADIVKRYDVDAIHMDDYFYPYPEGGKPFPDDKDYVASGTSLSKGDWRRANVDSMIINLNDAIKNIKPWVKFGISPFSVWRNDSQDTQGSDSKAGITNYDDLYADILLWLRKGWIDYVTPQLYREIGDNLIAFDKLLNWWADHSFGRHVYIGHGIYRATENAPKWKIKTELPNQIKLVRANPNIQGSIYFTSGTFKTNPNGWNDTLQNNYYKYQAVVPPMPWLPKKPK